MRVISLVTFFILLINARAQQVDKGSLLHLLPTKKEDTNKVMLFIQSELTPANIL